MITSRVTPPTEEDGVKVDGVEEVGGVAVYVWGAAVKAVPHSDEW